MTLIMPHIAARLFGEPLLIDPGKLSAIMIGLGGRIVDGGLVLNGVAPIEHHAFENGRPSDSVLAAMDLSPGERVQIWRPSEQLGRLGDPMGRAIEAQGYGSKIVPRIGNVGIIPIEGTLVHKGKYLGQSSGQTSYEGLQTRFARAKRDPDIKAVIYEVDSYGGEGTGAFEAAEAAYQLSLVKPTLAILTENAYSAGYLMASTARQIVMPETGGAGHIGALIMHADFSKKLENDGVKLSLIASGAHKTAGHPALPLSDSVRQQMQASVDRSREIFATAVGRYRGRRLDRAAALATEAQTYKGQDAVDAGIVDGIVNTSEAFDAFLSKFN